MDDGLELMSMRVTHVVPHISRVRTLRILLRTERVVELLRPFRDIAAPRLQHLEIVKVSDEEATTLAIFSSGAPKLRFLKIDGLTPDLSAAPWTVSLTHLQLRRYQFDWGITNLSPLTAQCPSLIHLHFDLHFSTNGDRVHIPTLKSLHISVSEDAAQDHLLDLINRFDTPALT
ncbi:hypothetical protein B0H12DRAFT_83269 [Mycena haematopus]|nr:hypothetical protein B0H12DRAFT_83269 [Mycena haematopus]